MVRGSEEKVWTGGYNSKSRTNLTCKLGFTVVNGVGTRKWTVSGGRGTSSGCWEAKSWGANWRVVAAGEFCGQQIC